MSETRLSEGSLVTLENATAASNIAAGRMICVNTAVNTLYSFSLETTGFSATGGGAGVRFVGILDEAISAGQCPITVWTDGVFRLQMASSISTAFIGQPVFVCLSGGGALVSNSGITGNLPIGTIVGLPTGELSGQFVSIKIVPGAFNWGTFGRVDAIATGNAVLDQGDGFPSVI